MNLIIHTPECRENTRRIVEANKAYADKWPKHCVTCGGHGGKITSQSHPYGSTTASEDLFDACPNCIGGKGTCPRCGSSVPDPFDGDTYCPDCGWCWGSNAGDTLESLPDIECCNGNTIITPEGARLVRVILFPFDLLSPAAKHQAIVFERSVRVQQVAELAISYVEEKMKLCRSKFLVGYPFDMVTAILDSRKPFEPIAFVVNTISGAPATHVEETLTTEIPMLLSDDSMENNIRANKTWFLADGTPWLYESEASHG